MMVKVGSLGYNDYYCISKHYNGKQKILRNDERGHRYFKEFGVPYEAKIVSAHLTPDNRIKVIIAADGAAHLAGVV
jgi:phosphoribosylcarboxyaminoimidazole (NCAIR) mutase